MRAFSDVQIRLQFSPYFLEICLDMLINNPDVSGSGEICYKGRNIFMGYLGDKIKTEETIDELGYLHSGDLG